MRLPFSTAGLAHLSASRPWTVIAVWTVLFLIGGWLSSGVSSVLNNDQRQTNSPDSQQAVALLEDRGLRGEPPLDELVLVRSESLTTSDPAFQAEVGRVLDGIRGLGDVVVSATSYYETQAPSMVSEDGHTTILPVTLNGVLQDSSKAAEPFTARIEQLDEANPQFEVLTTGYGSLNETFSTLAEQDLQSEFRTLPVALLVLVIVFGAVVAALIPMVVAFVAIIIATGAATLVGHVWPLSFFITNFILSIGLALGIDYSLFIVERFREERALGRDKIDAITVAGDTATRAVLFSGLTVIIALLGMFIVPQAIFRSLAAGAILVAVFAVLASLTLQPAILAVLGDRVNRLGIPFLMPARHDDENRGFWAGLARFVMRFRVPSAVLAAGLLVAIGVSYFNINLGFAGASSLPEDTRARKAYDLLASEFSAGAAAPAEVVVDAPDVTAPDVQAAIARLQADVAEDPTFGPMDVVLQSDNTVLLHAPLAAEIASPEERAAIGRLRNDLIPNAFDGVQANVLVSGIPGSNADFFGMVDQFTPIVFGFVLTLSFVLLLLVFRSVVVPLKAIIMNVLSVGAAYGMLVLVFQEGIGADLLGFQTVDTIEAWLPLMLFTILFGLSMDYHVFLLSRIRERYDQTRQNRESVAFGLRSTANIITGAAAIMIVVFGGFATGQMVMFQQMGFGLAVAILLDATVVRTILVPSTMAMLGDWNWYLPSWLRWLPDFRVEGGSPAAPTPLPAGAVTGSGGAGGD